LAQLYHPVEHRENVRPRLSTARGHDSGLADRVESGVVKVAQNRQAVLLEALPPGKVGPNELRGQVSEEILKLARGWGCLPVGTKRQLCPGAGQVSSNVLFALGGKAWGLDLTRVFE
jgi:hypothetical protein